MVKKEKVIMNKAMGDGRLSMCHLSLISSIVHVWKENSGKNPFNTSRRKLMQLSRIKSISTYHRCLKEIVKMGYIEYNPSYHPKLGSEMII